MSRDELPTRPVPYPDFDGTQECLQVDPEMWFPRSMEETYRFPVGLRHFCNPCPFFKQCLDYAVSNDVDGIWAGTTPRDRKRERKRLGIKAIPVALADLYFIAELDNPTQSVHDLAGAFRVSAKTVERHRARKAVA